LQTAAGRFSEIMVAAVDNSSDSDIGTRPFERPSKTPGDARRRQETPGDARQKVTVTLCRIYQGKGNSYPLPDISGKR
jgi:hypothetical protein